ncbi:hypothetical protein MSP8887_02466 [Marinomonas spartinae]|uniref:ABC transporter substrate-binding protein n=1 Tax=Marinomonas spartinae TaxID=1792290 RepID=UPI00080912D2|nr:ABC transporter substrate-binding protein [Marinomonas spartinae]SBS35794.1 hypothetical protein MSP8887_02466 [Marinomonas spartinae]
MSKNTLIRSSVSRRQFIKGASGGIVSLGLLGSPSLFANPDNVIRIGYVMPRSGPLSSFSQGDDFLLKQVHKQLANGLNINGVQYALEFFLGDTQSSTIRASQVASDLINGKNIDLMLTSSTPETVNPVADACEAAGVPCLSTTAPWESFYYGRGAKPGQPSPFKWTYHFCFGVADFAKLYTDQWSKVKTNNRVGMLLPNDANGNSIRHLLIPQLEKAGYTVVDSGPYEDGASDFSQQINLFKKEHCEIFNPFPFPPDFPVFWRQAAQKGYAQKVKIAQLAKAGLFPAELNSLGRLGYGLAAGAYWHKDFPFASGSTGLSSQQIASGFEKSTGKQWNQQVGATASLFDAAIEALIQSNAPKDKVALVMAITKLRTETAVGIIDFTKGPVPNCATTGLVGVQWVKAQQGPWEFALNIVSNADHPLIKVTSTMTPYRIGG